MVDLPDKGRAVANIGQSNNLSTLMFLSVLSAVYLFERRLLSAVVVLLVTLLLLLAALVAQSRSFWLLIAVAIVWLLLSRRQLPLRLSLAVVICVAAAYLFAAYNFEWLSGTTDPGGKLSERFLFDFWKLSGCFPNSGKGIFQQGKQV